MILDSQHEEDQCLGCIEFPCMCQLSYRCFMINGSAAAHAVDRLAR